jgi:uncharacterized protein (TIGR02466 family)|tara:strand:+ start:95 stop:712 length:618 start_codon:yes stop_codon:yes gene_type:complete
MFTLTENLLFVTSCFTTYVETSNHTAIVESIEKLQEVESGNYRSNEGGFQSYVKQSPDFDNLETAGLFNNIIFPAAKMVANSWSLPSEMNRAGYWYNVNYKYSSNREHTHPNAFLSGVYYIKVPEASGNIVLLRANSEHDKMEFMHQKITENNLRIDNNRINTEHWFAPKEGMLILFPGHLTHYVRQNLTNEVDDRRISLSFNFW